MLQLCCRDDSLNNVQTITAEIRKKLSASIAQLRDWIEATNANPDEHLIEIVIDIEDGTTKVSDRFLWDICSPLADADVFASSFCGDAGLEREVWSKRVADEIRMQCFRYAISRAGSIPIAGAAVGEHVGAGGNSSSKSSQSSKLPKRKFGVRKFRKEIAKWTPMIVRDRLL